MPELNFYAADSADTAGTHGVVLQPYYQVSVPGYNYGSSNNPAGSGFMEWGSGTPGSLPFRVDQNGNVTGASFTGPATSVGIQPSGDTTGTTDTSNIQTAIGSGNTGVYLAPGNFYVSNINAFTNTLISGSGVGTVLNATSTAPTGVVTCSTAATGVYLQNFLINGHTKGTVDGVYLSNTGLGADSRHRLTNIQVLNSGGDGIHLGPAVIETVVEGCYVHTSGNYGFSTEVSATDNKFIGCTSGASISHGYYIQGNTTHFIGCKSFYSGYNGSAFSGGGCGFYLGPAASQQLRLVLMTSCEAQNNGGDGFHIDGSPSAADVEYCTFVNCVADGNNEQNQTFNGFSVLHAVESTFTNCVVHNQASGANPGNHNFSLALFDSMSGTTFNNCYLPAGQGGEIYFDGSLSGPYKITSCQPYNPVGLIGSPPAVAGSTTAVTNTTGVDAMVIVTGSSTASTTSIALGGNATGISGTAASAVLPPVRVPANETIALTYTHAPTWTWWGD